jgi:hypothetical protein
MGFEANFHFIFLDENPEGCLFLFLGKLRTQMQQLHFRANGECWNYCLYDKQLVQFCKKKIVTYCCIVFKVYQQNAKS